MELLLAIAIVDVGIVAAHHLIVAVHIVAARISGEAVQVMDLHAEQAGHVAFVCASPQLCVSHGRLVVFTLEPHIHHQSLEVPLAFIAREAVLRLLVHLHVLHHIGGQIGKEGLPVIVEEVLSVEQQGVHQPSVGIDFPVLEFQTGHLLEDVIQHEAVLRHESIGIVYQRVVLEIELDFAGLHLQLAQVALHDALHAEGAKLGIELLAVKLDVDQLIKWFIIRM